MQILYEIAFSGSVAECAMCREVLEVLQQILSNPRIDRDFGHLMEKTCNAVPSKYFNYVSFNFFIIVFYNFKQ